MGLFSLPNMIDVALNSANRRDGATDVTVLLRGLQDAPLPFSAIDERREDFAPSLWRSREGVDLRQVWFAWCHASTASLRWYDHRRRSGLVSRHVGGR